MKFQVALLVLLAVAASGCVQLQQLQNTSQLENFNPIEIVTGNNANSTSAVVPVLIEEAGFDPSVVTIKAGDTVKWTNNGNAPSWPLSDVAGSSGDPEFDAKGGLFANQAYEHTFESAGNFTYHDSLRPIFVGKVIVLENVNYTKS